jgi:predicted secreted protein
MSNIKKFLPIALLLYAISACNETMVRVQDGNNDNQIRAEVNKNFSIQLESQLSTGFSWKLMEYPEYLSIVQENVRTEENNKTGGIDIQEFILKSSSKGEFDILFQYGEHWKKNPEYEKSSKIKVVIE